MMIKLVKTIGQPLCIILYIASVIMAFKKKFAPLIALFTLHLAEYFIIGKKTGKENGISALSSLLHCLAFGFTWWLPIRKDK